MKLSQIVAIFMTGRLVMAAGIPQDVIITVAPATVTATVETDDIPVYPQLEKRVHKEYVDKQKERLKAAEGKYQAEAGSSSSDGPRKWLRTIYGTKIELVTPTVIAGVTISAKPPATTNGLEPWISLKKDGSPKTIRPQIKNGHTKNASPTYDTWFSTPTKVVYTKEDLKAHNMAEDEVFEDIEWIEEDTTYRSLNPIIRCTPDSYFKKGINKQTSSEPFCFPKDNSGMLLDREYFITWYSRFFDADSVKLHLSAIKPSLKDHGYKRDGGIEDKPQLLDKRSAIMDNGGKITGASFFTTDWIENAEGIFPIKIMEDFFTDSKQMTRKVLLSIQPDTVEDSEFDLLKNSLVLELRRPGNVYKGHNEDIEVLDQMHRSPHLTIEVEEGLDYEKYFVIFGIPLFVVGLFFVMLVFVKVNKVDLSHLKPRKALGKNHNHRRVPLKKKGYSLPQHTNDIPLKNLNKAD